MSYCTVEEAWGPNFGRTNVSLHPPQGAPNRVEHFGNDGHAGYNSSLHNGYDDGHGHYATTNLNQQNHVGCDYHNPERRKEVDLGKSCNPGGVPYARDDRMGGFKKEPAVFYPLDSEAGKDHILNYSYDYDEEDQLGARKIGNAGCSSAFDHLLTCKECRMKIANSIQSEGKESKDSNESNESSPDIDLTELALFVACGVL